jgi:hypothetical protein
MAARAVDGRREEAEPERDAEDGVREWRQMG